MDKSEKVIILIVLIALVGCLCIAVTCGISVLLVANLADFNLTSFLEEATPTRVSTPVAATPRPQSTRVVNVDSAEESLLTLMNAEIPTADLVFLAEHFEGKSGIPLRITSAPVEYEVGDTLGFYKLNTDTNEMETTIAVLRYKTDTVYFWVEQGVEIDQSALRQMMSTFVNEIYPTDQEFFGKEWIPGVDNDPHLYILYAGDLGYSLAGYTSSTDSVLPQAHEYSNAHEMFAINSDVQTLYDPYTLSVMAHEFQHLIHGYHDPNEETWLNEGFSELATLLNGYDAGGFDNVFAYNPDIQLNDWSANPEENDAHYGASFLYTTYLLDRFGEEITKRIVADPLNGYASIDRVFQEANLIDEVTGELITADDFFVDWTIANYFLDPNLGDGRYVYSNYPGAPSANSTDVITDCSATMLASSVKQYGTDYYEIFCHDQKVRLHFEGDPTVPVLPEVTGEGKFMWSNRADTSVTSLSREFDLTDVSGPITLTYQTWYDLEMDYDYAYLLASENGRDWKILNTPSCTTLDISGNSYGCGYNGGSQRWLTESVDLSGFAGKKVWLSFEYVTDAAVTAEGFILDNISIPEIGYRADFEEDDGGWQAQGFVRIENYIPQTFLVSVVSNSTDEVIQKFSIKSGEVLELVLDPLPSSGSYVVIVSGSARYTRQEANYQIELVIN